jgi:hypothetical protein
MYNKLFFSSPQLLWLVELYISNDKLVPEWEFVAHCCSGVVFKVAIVVVVVVVVAMLAFDDVWGESGQFS